MLLIILYTSLIAYSLFLPSEGLKLTLDWLEKDQECADHESLTAVLQLLIEDLETLVSAQQKLIPEMHIIHTKKQRVLEHQKRLEELLKRPDRTTTTTKSTTTETTTTTKSTTTETTTTTVSTTEQTTTTTKNVPPRRGRNCAEVITPSKGSGIYEIFIPSFREQAIKVACDAETHGGNWTIILKRFDGSVDFYHNWFQYKIGFGTLSGEFFLGLDKLHALTNDMPQELYFILEDFQGDVRYEFYDDFAIGDESEWYLLHTLGRASGTAGDSFSIHHRMYFTTRDRDHDRWIYGNCAIKETGAWWYNDCSNSNLMGRYNDHSFSRGINWGSFRGFFYSLKRAVMMIRPRTSI